jgi:hypothetical protein
MFGMTCNQFSGRIFKLPFPFTDLSSSKARPAIALTEPDKWINGVILNSPLLQPNRAGRLEKQLICRKAFCLFRQLYIATSGIC